MPTLIFSYLHLYNKIRRSMFMSKGLKLKFIKFSNLYKKISYTAPIESIVNRITEYDIKQAGYNICKKYDLVDKDVLDKIKDFDKVQKSINLGLEMLKDRGLYKRLRECMEIEKMGFFSINSIQDSDILSIKNDAIFLIGIRPKYRKFGNIEFVPKNKYTSYLNINKIEFYYNSITDDLDVKGIKDDILEDHKNGMVKFIKRYMKLNESGEIKKLKKFLVDFAQKYKEYKVPEVYYRTFDTNNSFIFKEEEEESDIEDDIHQLDISFNYLFFILPLLQRSMFR